jgi:hypothetical protein
MPYLSSLIHIYRGRGLWGFFVNVADVHLHAYLQGSRPMGRFADVDLHAYL